MDLKTNEIILSIIGLIGSGGFLTVVGNIFVAKIKTKEQIKIEAEKSKESNREANDEMQKYLNEELRKQKIDLEKKINNVQEVADKYQKSYWDLYGKYAMMESSIESIKVQLDDKEKENKTLKNKNQHLEKEAKKWKQCFMDEKELNAALKKQLEGVL